jgi:hypothetical protein
VYLRKSNDNFFKGVPLELVTYKAIKIILWNKNLIVHVLVDKRHKMYSEKVWLACNVEKMLELGNIFEQKSSPQGEG